MEKIFKKLVSISFTLALLVGFGFSSTASASGGKSVDTSPESAATAIEESSSRSTSEIGIQSTNTKTVTAYKGYKNPYGIVTAKHWAYTKWSYDGVYINSYNGTWQDSWTATGYNSSPISSAWNSTGSKTGESNNATQFTSSMPTPWGHIQISNFTSRILTTIYGSGNWTVR